jgi:3-hydroxyacyl-CoA dehydrogenase
MACSEDRTFVTEMVVTGNGRDGNGARVEVKTIAVIGADTVGCRIASIAALSGYDTVLEDVSNERLAKAAAWIERNHESFVAGGTPEARGRDAAAARLSLAHTVEDAIRDADLIIETLPDEMEMQIELFTILDKFAKPNAIFASTGFLSITELAEITFCADRCIGMRFLESAEGMKVVELIKLVRGSQTSLETIARCAEVARRMGREVVVLDETAPNRSGESERRFANAQD